MAGNVLTDETIKYSIQDQEPDTLTGARADGYPSSLLFGAIGYKSQYLYPWHYTWLRSRQLRSLWYEYENTLVIGALTNLINREQQTPWELVGPASTVSRWHELLTEVQFGDGWDNFKERLWMDFLGQDKGAFVEVIGQGEPDTPLDRGAVGLSVLDATRCYVTGNAEFPVWYQSHRSNKWHKLHRTRVVRFVDMPSPDPAMRGLGLCALSRAAAVAQTQYLMSRYRAENLQDLPPKGFLTVSGLTDKQFNQAMANYHAKRNETGAEVFGGVVRLTATDLESGRAAVDITPFANMPDGFDYVTSMENDVNLLAIAIGDDPLEIWTLTGGGLNNSGQAKMLHSKGKSKILGKMRTLVERKFNHNILPRNLELKYKPKDTEQDLQDAQLAKTWGEMASRARSDGAISVSEYRLMLANTVASFRDVLLDENGEVLRLPDDDSETLEQQQPVDVTQQSDETQETLSDAVRQEETETRALKLREYVTAKDIQATRSRFEDDVQDIINSASSGGLSRRRFIPIMRAVLSRAINSAYEDGLRVGGVDPADKSRQDDRAIAGLVADANSYLRSLSEQVYMAGLTELQINEKPVMWWNKSVSPAYDAGRMSADRNGMYEWALGQTEEHCSDCLRLDGQVHRLRSYMERDLVPKSSRLECGGWHCDCSLNRSTERARGRF